MKKTFLLLIPLTIALSSCATVDVQTDFSPSGTVSRTVNAFVDSTTYKFNQTEIDNYDSGVLQRGGKFGSWVVNISNQNGELQISAQFQAQTMQDISKITQQIFSPTDTGSNCQFQLVGDGGITGVISKYAFVDEKVKTSCLEYVTGQSTYTYNGQPIGTMSYPDNSEAIFRLDGITNPTTQAILYTVCFFAVFFGIVFMYFYEVPWVKQVIDFFAPSFVKLYYRLVLIIFAQNNKDNKKK